MRNRPSPHAWLILLAIAAILAVPGWLPVASAAEPPTPGGPGQEVKTAPPATYDPATVKPAADEAEAEDSGMDDFSAEDAAADESAADESSAAAAPAVKPGGVQPLAKEAPSPSPGLSRKLRFQFRFAPWKDVLDWFAQRAGLSLMADATPPGTFNYSDDREYTPEQALDLLNEVLLTKGYVLVRRQRMLVLINLEDGIPPNLVPTITPDALQERGEYELVSVLFDLEKVRPEDAETEIARLLGPQGTAVPLARSRQILVTETAGRLRAIRSILARIEEVADERGGPDDVLGVPRARRIALNYARAQEVAEVIKQVYPGQIVEGPGTGRGSLARMFFAQRTESAAAASGTQQRGAADSARPGEEAPRMTIAVAPRTNSLLVSAPWELFQEVKQLVEELDQAAGDQEQTMRVVPLRRVTAEAVQQGLSAAGGDLAKFSTHTPSSTTPAQPAASPWQQWPQPPSDGSRFGYWRGRSGESGRGPGAASGTTPQAPTTRGRDYRSRSAPPNSRPGQ